MRVLLAAHPTVGHISALVTIGRRLREAGAHVRFAIPALPAPRFAPEIIRTAARLPETIEAAGLCPVRLRPSLGALPWALAIPWTSGSTELRCAAELFTAGAATQARALTAELERSPAEVVVADYLFFAAWLAAELSRVPFVSLYHSALPFPSHGKTPFGAGEALVRTFDRRLARARRVLGLPPLAPRFIERPYPVDLNLLATAPALEGRDDDLGPRTRYVGPCLDGRVEDTSAFPFHRLRRDACRVYLSLGTVFNTRPDRFRALIQGISGPGVQVVVSAGASRAALADLESEQVMIFPRVPQLAVLDAVDIVISHGGNNTINEALRAGRPLLVLPVGGEQEVNARRVEALGAGIALDRARITAARVREAFARLRHDSSFSRRAAAIGEAVAGMEGAARAASLITDVAERRPIA